MKIMRALKQFDVHVPNPLGYSRCFAFLGYFEQGNLDILTSLNQAHSFGYILVGKVGQVTPERERSNQA